MNRNEKLNYYRLTKTLEAAGFDYEEVNTLLRIEKTLQRWGERECGDSNEYSSWAIERDETTGKPYEVRQYYPRNGHQAMTTRTAIADREAGALKRARAIAEKHGCAIYHQSDPRGCAIYIIRPGDVPDGADVSSCYNRGVGVYVSQEA